MKLVLRMASVKISLDDPFWRRIERRIEHSGRSNERCN